MFHTTYCFVCQEQTKPTTPAAPQSLESSSQTNSSVFLSWRLPRPPTGELDKFLLQVKFSVSLLCLLGLLATKSLTTLTNLFRRWAVLKKTTLSAGGVSRSRKQLFFVISTPPDRFQVEGHHSCNFNSEPVELYCYSVTGLDPGVSYRFRVRAWNLEVDEPSLWSSELTQATAMGESTISSSTLSPNPSSEITPTPSPSSSPLVIAVVSILAIIVIFAIVIVCLVYKLKITRLKQQMRNEEEWNQLGHLSHSSSYLPGEFDYFQSLKVNTISLFRRSPLRLCVHPPSRLLPHIAGDHCGLWLPPLGQHPDETVARATYY